MVAPKLNRRRAAFVLCKIDEILAWEQAADRERDSRFVDLGRYLCEVRGRQYWRLDNLRSFDEFLERKFPESRRKAYYLMAIHEHLPRIPKAELRSMGWTKARELAKVARRDRQGFVIGKLTNTARLFESDKLRPPQMRCTKHLDNGKSSGQGRCTEPRCGLSRSPLHCTFGATTVRVS